MRGWDVISKGNIDKYLRDVHKYVWVSSSMDYMNAKMKLADKTVFFDSDFVGREEGGDSVLYVFGDDVLRGIDFYSEGVVKHRRLIRGVRAVFKNINFVSKEHLPISGVERVLVGENHLDKVNSLFRDNNLDIPVSLI